MSCLVPHSIMLNIIYIPRLPTMPSTDAHRGRGWPAEAEWAEGPYILVIQPHNTFRCCYIILSTT